MKRDMNLIRDILLKIEASSEGFTSFTGVEAAHVQLLRDADLVDASILGSDGRPPSRAIVVRLTWKGHDFLDAMKDDTIWNQARETILKPAGTATFEVLFEWLRWQGKKALGMPET